jgi:uncharacterized membrane protein
MGVGLIIFWPALFAVGGNDQQTAAPPFAFRVPQQNASVRVDPVVIWGMSDQADLADLGFPVKAARCMTLAPLLNAAPVIQIHAFAAMGAFGLGVYQLARRKGTPHHRLTGWIWVGLMLTVVLTSFWIHELRLWGPWSPIHLLSIFTLVMLPVGVWRARHHQVQRHRWTMISIFAGALVIAGIFTFVPGRIMHTVVFAINP